MEETKTKAKKWMSRKVVMMMFYLTVNGVGDNGQRCWSNWLISYVSDVQFYMEKTEKIVKKNAKKAWHFPLRLVLTSIIMVDCMFGHKGVQVMGGALRYQKYG